MQKMSHVFISYVRENEDVVNKLDQELTLHGIEVWRDVRNLGPGARWKQEIRNAIREGSFFIACFSKEYNNRVKTQMNEELLLAIEQLRLRPNNKVWFIPIKLNECEIPSLEISSTETLNDLNHVKLYEDWNAGIQRILGVIQQGSPSPQQVHPATSTYSEAIEITSNQNSVKWRQLIKQARSTVSTSLVQWGRDELLSGHQPRDGEQFVDEAVDIISPLISAALAGVESGQEHFNNQRSVLNNILSVSDPDLDSRLTWERIRYTLGYVYHSLHGALSINTEQIDLALDVARVKVQFWNKQNNENLWKAFPFMGWSKLIGENHCTEGWKYLSSAYNRWEWLGSIFPDESEYRVSLVAYYMALDIHELASVIASGKQETSETSHLNKCYVPLTFISEGRDINQRAITHLQSNPEALAKLWASLNVTRTEMEDSWKNWIYKCEFWLGEVYGIGVDMEICHENFFENY